MRICCLDLSLENPLSCLPLADMQNLHLEPMILAFFTAGCAMPCLFLYENVCQELRIRILVPPVGNFVNARKNTQHTDCRDYVASPQVATHRRFYCQVSHSRPRMLGSDRFKGLKFNGHSKEVPRHLSKSKT
jgi:hypothetical protein